MSCCTREKRSDASTICLKPPCLKRLKSRIAPIHPYCAFCGGTSRFASVLLPPRFHSTFLLDELFSSPRFPPCVSFFVHCSSFPRENVTMILPRTTVQTVQYINPQTEVNAGLWTLFAGTSVFLAVRVWCKLDFRQSGLWYDDHILIVSWVSASNYLRFQRKVHV